MKSEHMVLEIERTETDSEFRKDLKKHVLIDEMGSFVFLRLQHQHLIRLYILGSINNDLWEWDYLGDSSMIMTLL